MCHFWLDPKVTKRSRLTLTGYFETYARCRIPTRFAQTGCCFFHNADSRSLRVTTTPANAPGTIYFLLLVTGCGRYMVYLIGRLSERPVILEFVCQKGLCLSDVGGV